MRELRQLYAQQVARRGYQCDAAQLAVIQKLDMLRDKLSARRKPGAHRWLARLALRQESAIRGMYLWGGVGRGKTWLMDLFFQSLPFAQRRRCHFHRFMHDVHARLRLLGECESPLVQVAQSLAQEAQVLCFDELFVSDIADAMILGGLFDALFQQGVTLVVTSNVPPRELYKNGLQRLRFLPAIKSIEAHTEIVEVRGAADYRLRQLTQAGTYLRSNDAATHTRLEALFREMSGESEAHVGVLQIEGRDIPVIKAAQGVAWFDFEALCEGPRSAADYIELAREYQSLIVSNVPVLTETRENASRRLISLIDELYDRNVNLVMSAAAAPRDLYQGERLRHEYERTVSRLIEMQSEEYLAREHRP